MKTTTKLLLSTVLWFFVFTPSFAQYCDSTVPTFNVDLSASPNMNWVSPVINRQGHCCGVTNPDVCIEFVITLHASAIAVNFNIASGAIPPGALFYQIDCGPQTPVGDPICLNGPGPHHLTFCKPGNNSNSFSITSYSNPIIGPDITLNAGCQGEIFALYYNEPSISWTSIAPGPIGAYDSFLTCTSGCDTTTVTAPTNAPAYVDYLVCGSDIGGCDPNPICDTIRVNFIAPVQVSIAAALMSLCAGETTTLTATVTDGTGPYTYLWNTAEISDQITVGPGTYFVDVLDSSGCYTASDTIEILQFVVPPVAAGVDQSVCDGEAVTLIGSGALSYSWDNGVVDGIPFIQTIGTITYTVVGTDANGCTASDQVDVTVNPLPAVDAGVNQIVCEGTAVTLNGAGALTYVWDNGVTDDLPFVPAVGTLTYTVTGTDANGCVNMDQMDVTVNPLPVISAGIDQTVCEWEMVTLNGSGAVSYSWNNGVTDGVSFAPSVGTTTYSVIGTDANGCVNTDQVDVAVNPLPNVNAGTNQVVCEGVTVTLSASGALTYVWDNGVVDGVTFVQSVGTTTYTVIGTDVNGCVNTDLVNVTVNSLPAVDAGLNQTVCEGTAVTLNGTGALTYAWDNGITNNVSFVPAVGTVTYIVSGTDVNGCVNTDQADVTVNPLPVIDAGVDQTVCEGEAVTLSGSGAISYVWNNGVANGVAFIPAVGTATYTVTGTDANGCINTDQVDVTVNPLPNVNAGADQTACQGSAVTLTATGATSFVWDNGVVNGVPFGQPVGTMTYTVIGTDANSCENIDQVDVTVYGLPVVVAGTDVVVCESTPVTLSASGANSYVWDNGVLNGVSFIQTVGTITYTVIGTDLNGCSSSDQVDVLVNPTPQVETQSDLEICEGVTATVFGTGAATYSWSNGIFDNVTFTPPVGLNLYEVTGTDINGCTDTAAISIHVHPTPLVNGGSDQEVCEGSSVVLSAVGALAYVWTGGVVNGVAFIPVVGQHTYEVTGTDLNGCIASDMVTVIVNPNPVVAAGPDQEVCYGTEVTLSATGSSNLSWSGGVINNQPFVQDVGVVIYTVYDTLPTGCHAWDQLTVTVYSNPIVSASDVEVCEGGFVILNGEGALTYSWSGGIQDGIAFAPNESGLYTVSGFDANGCSSSATAQVVVHENPYVAFTWNNQDLSMTTPGTDFNNLSVGASSFAWDFGDGVTSNAFEPYHEFPDEEGGEYWVTLTGTSDEGCVSVATEYLEVEQDYSIFVPNTFTPDNNGVNEHFTPVLFGFDEEDFTLYIFNRWGQLVFESHNMDIGWDGTLGNSADAVQDGVFTWKIVARVKNSIDRKAFTGHVTLLK